MEFPVTADQVRQTVTDYGITHLPHHDCGFCGEWVKYVFTPNTSGEMAAFFDSNCACSSYWTPRTASDWEDVAEFINQRDTVVAQTIWDRLMAQATKQPPKPIGTLGAAGGIAGGNPVVTVSTEELHAWLRSVADAHGLKGQEMLTVQFTWEEMDASQPAPGNMHTEVRAGIPELTVMVSNIPNSRVPS